MFDQQQSCLITIQDAQTQTGLNISSGLHDLKTPLGLQQPANGPASGLEGLLELFCNAMQEKPSSFQICLRFIAQCLHRDRDNICTQCSGMLKLCTISQQVEYRDELCMLFVQRHKSLTNVSSKLNLPWFVIVAGIHPYPWSHLSLYTSLAAPSWRSLVWTLDL